MYTALGTTTTTTSRPYSTTQTITSRSYSTTQTTAKSRPYSTTQTTTSQIETTEYDLYDTSMLTCYCLKKRFDKLISFKP